MKNTIRIVGLSTGLAMVVFVIAVTLIGLRSERQASATSSSIALPALQGAAAIEHLKQQGLYDSLNQAMTAARYGVKPVPEAQRNARGSDYVADNSAQQL